MKLCISHDAARSLVKLAVTARVVYGVLIDMPQLFNAGWLCVLVGGALALPIWFAVSQIRKHDINRTSISFRAVCAVFFLLCVYDAGILATSVSESASYMALNSTASIYLTLPLLLLCLFCLRFNGNALGSSAGVWNRILPCILVIIILLQLGDYKPEWLTPVLGPGVKELFKSAVKVAGWFTLPVPLLLLTDSDERNPKKASLAYSLCLSAATAALICIAFSMMVPAIPEEKLFVRSFRLETLLSNGRSGLAMQFPAIAIWYLGLFYALLTDVFAGSILLQHAFPGMNRFVCMTAPLTISALLAASSLSDRTPALTVSGWLYPIHAALFVTVLLTAMKGDNRDA